MNIFLLLILSLPFISGAASAQEMKESVHVIGPAHCQDYGPVLDIVSQNAPVDLPIIVIARRGQGDIRTDLNRRRLHNVRTYWTEFRSDKRALKSVILAEGERVEDHGRLEIYVGGKLTATPEFFMEYKVLKQTTDLPEMVVYWLRDKRRVIAWSKTKLSANPFKLNEVELTRDFLKALKKVRGEKKT